MGASEEAREQDVQQKKVLALSPGEGAANAYCLSSYGAFMALNVLSPSDVREVFQNTRTEELLNLAESLLSDIKDKREYPEQHEGEIKDLLYKREILLSMAHKNEEEKDLVRPDSDGRFTNPREDK